MIIKPFDGVPKDRIESNRCIGANVFVCVVELDSFELNYARTIFRHELDCCRQFSGKFAFDRAQIGMQTDAKMTQNRPTFLVQIGTTTSCQ